MKRLEIGTAKGVPGAISYGQFDALALPTGGMEHFPVIIAQGDREGPVLWLTAGIHGDEYTGIQVIHQFLTPELVKQMRGAIVAIPTLNPSGLRVGDRVPYYMKKQDPNRIFPALPRRKGGDSNEILSPLELAYRRLFEKIRETADYLIDLHNYSLGALPFSFCDPVYYTDEREKPVMQKIWETLGEMLNAFGMTVIREYASEDYLRRNLHRSVSGAVLHVGRIPAFTAELGGYLTVDQTIVNATMAGIRNVMRWGGMLPGKMEPIQGVQVINPGYPVRRLQHPHAPESGIVRFLVKSGDPITAGQAVATITDIYGRPIGPENGLIRTRYSGFVLGVIQGTSFYQNDPILTIAIQDTSEMVLPYPG